MKRSPITALVATVSCAALFLGISATAADAKPIKYKFSGGQMYTLEYNETNPGPFPYTPTTRWGRITAMGKVVPLSGDLGLKQVTDADYSSAAGLVFVLANGYAAACELWSFDPDDPEETLARISSITTPGGSGSLGVAPTRCGSLLVMEDGTIAVQHADDGMNGFFVDYYSPVTGDWINQDGFWSGEFWAMDLNSENQWLTITPEGYFNYWGRGQEGQISDTATLHSAKFDLKDRAWILQWGSRAKIGILNPRKGKVKWGKVLVESGTRNSWFTDTLVFVPNVR